MITALPVAAANADTVSGPPQVSDGATMVVAGKTVKLAGIAVPQPGDECDWQGRILDCGKMAKAGLMDITADAVVTCVAVDAGDYRCTADNYDLAYGLIHAGWAVPVAGAPARYFRKMDEARRHKRMLWRARSLDKKQAMASTLTR